MICIVSLCIHDVYSQCVQVAASYMGRAAAAEPKSGKAPPAAVPGSAADAVEQEQQGDPPVGQLDHTFTVTSSIIHLQCLASQGVCGCK